MFDGKKVLITGGTGSLGIALTQIAAGLLKGEDEKEIEKLIPRALFHTPIGIGAGAL